MSTPGSAAIGLDVGGANTKAARADATGIRTTSRVHEVWKDLDGLARTIAAVVAEVQETPDERVAVTTTAELSDAFASKAEGVAFVLDAVQRALGPRPWRVITTAGILVSPGAARARPLDVAAANWVATALVLARDVPDAIVVDVGSTTTDVIPLAAGRLAASGRTDLGRLRADELVYTGALRTNAAAIATHVPVDGRPCRVASESFAISADVRLVLRHLQPAQCDCRFPDDRRAGIAESRARLARLVCADADELGAERIAAIARHLHDEQVSQIAAALTRVAARFPAPPPVLPLGIGAELARAAARTAGLAVQAPPTPWNALAAAVAPATALSLLGADA